MLVGFLVCIIASGPTALLIGADSFFDGARHSANPTSPSPADRVVPATVGRDPISWPFSRDSIWNLPIGVAAVYVPSGIQRATAMGGLPPDSNVLILTPNAPITPVYYNADEWSGGSRCEPQGGILFQAPIPTNFVIPGARPGWTPNYATAILLADGHTLVQGQPSARCTTDGPTTMWWYQTNEVLSGTGVSGAHGGSMLSSIGGTIRLGELVPAGVIRHAMKVNFDGVNYYYDSVTRGYRWPASTSDSCAAWCYTGTTVPMRMGSLLALPPSINPNTMGLETEAARILARAFQDYGAYVVDNAGWSVYNIATEFSPAGSVEDEFAREWGFPMSSGGKDNPWARDIDRIFLNLQVVNNWNQVTWLTVSESNGLLGAGLGAPRVPWAPDFGEDTVAPQATNTLSGTLGADGWYRSAVTVTLVAEDEGSGVASIHNRIDNGAWQVYSAPVTVSAQGAHTIDYYATDVAGNQGSIQTVTFKIDTISPTATAALSGTLGADDWYTSPVTVTLTAADGGSGVALTQLRRDGGAWQVYSAPLTVSAQGAHTIDYYATDVAGNQAPTQTVTFKIDTISPTATAALSGTLGADDWYTSPVTVTLTAADGGLGVASIHYRIDGGAWQVYSAPVTVSEEGAHTIDYYATDVAGNQGSTQVSTFRIDMAGPVATHALTGTLGTSGWYISPVTVTLNTTSGNGSAESIEYSLDGGPRVPYAAPFEVAEGRHILEYVATDANGDIGAMKGVAIDVDYTAPTIVRAGPDNVVIPIDGTFSWTGSDAVAGIVRYEISIDGGPFQIAGAEATVTRRWTEGVHVAVVKAYDAAGNEATAKFSFRVDPEAEPQPAPVPAGPVQMIPFAMIALGLALLGLGAVTRARMAKGRNKGRSQGSSRGPPAQALRRP